MNRGDTVQAASALQPVRARRTHTLPVSRIHPVIRIAHRRSGPIATGPRVIFDHELILIEGGEGAWRDAHREAAVAAHDLLLVRPFEPHQLDVGGGENTAHVAVHFDLAPNVPPRARAPASRRPYRVELAEGHALPARMRLGAGHAYAHRVACLLASWQAGDALGPAEASAELLQLLLRLIRMGEPAAATAEEARDRARLERAVGFIHEHYPERLDVRRLAAVAGLSETHFARRFRRWTGHPPAEYVRRVRVAKARPLLAEPELPIKEIAHRTGFANPYHFSRVFRAIDGLPPTAVREMLMTDSGEEEAG